MRTKDQGKEVTKHAMEQLEMSQFVIQGESNAYHLTPGYRFTLTNHPNAEGSYILTSITHSASEGGFHSGEEIGQNHYANSFRSIPFSLLYRPPQHGSQTPCLGLPDRRCGGAFRRGNLYRQIRAREGAVPLGP